MPPTDDLPPEDLAGSRPETPPVNAEDDGEGLDIDLPDPSDGSRLLDARDKTIQKRDPQDRRRARLRKRLEQLHARLESLRAMPASRSEDTARELVDVERKFLQLTLQADQVLSEAVVQQGHPVLDDLLDWEDYCRANEAFEAEKEADALCHQLFRDDARRWAKQMDRQVREHTDDGQPSWDLLVHGLMESTTQHIEALRNRLADPPALRTILDTKDKLRKLFAQRASDHPPTDEQRELWASELLDQVDAQLAAVPDQTPEASARYLEVVIADVSWYLGVVGFRGRGRRHRKLRSKLERLKTEWQEQVLQDKLEARFGRGWVAMWERMMLILIFLVLIVITALLGFGELMSVGMLWTLEGLDACICAVFLYDFFFKFSIVPDRWRWFRRNWLFWLLPSIPFGLILLVVGAVAAPAADPTRYGRLARLMQLPRLVRYMALLRPLIALLRAFGFMVRGMDRIARMFSRVLNRNIILFPTRGERMTARQARHRFATAIRRVRAELVRRWRSVLVNAPDDLRDRVGRMRVEGLREACEQGYCDRPSGTGQRIETTQDISAEEMLRWLAAVTPQDVEAELGEHLVPRAARLVQLFARPPMRWLPIISACVPRVVVTMTDAEIVAAATRRTAAFLKRWHNRWFAVSDLYGTVTPSQFVDRVATMLINGSRTPFFRLLNFGGLYLLFLLIFWMVPYQMPGVVVQVFEIIQRLLGVTLLVLGGICAVLWITGLWLQRLAKEATDFFERAAQAQFLTLTEGIRCRSLLRDSEIIADRVLLPECRINLTTEDQNGSRQQRAFVERVKRCMMGLHIHGDTSRAVDSLERAAMLYRDALDGSLLNNNDTRTTNQLLGNPSIQQFQSWSLRVTPAEAAAIQRLDLVRQKSLFPGPYLWFNFITQAVSHSTAQLIIEYNRHAEPLPERELLTEAERQRFENWLHRTTVETRSTRLTEYEMAGQFVTTAFTALHFLDVDPHRDQEVADLFGVEVLERLQHDRGVMIRRIFGTYPLHNQPRDLRSVNLQTVYDEWLGGGRMALLPVFVAWRMLKGMGALLYFLWRSANELRRPHLRRSTDDAAEADFGTACRKIDRMRGPITRAAIHLRTLMDPEYLGIAIPGICGSTLSRADAEIDLEFLDAEPTMLEEVHYERQRAEADMQRLGDLLENDLLQKIADQLNQPVEQLNTPDHLRAAACAYLADLHGVRRHLSCHVILRQIFERTARHEPLPLRVFPVFRLKGAFARWWRQFGRGTRRDRKFAWRAVAHNMWGAADCLEVWDKLGDDAHEEGVRRLASLLRYPGRIGEQLVTIRMVQTLAVLDVLNYRQHVFQLGNYAAQGDDAEEFLAWGPIQARSDSIETPTLTNLSALQTSFSGRPEDS